MSEERRKLLVKTAKKLFLKNGFHSVSVRDITQKANCNVSSINYYFKNKYNLFDEVFKDHFEEISEQIEQLHLYQYDQKNQLKLLVELMRNNLKRNKDFNILMYQTLLNRTDKKLNAIKKNIVKKYIFPLCQRLQFISGKLSKVVFPNCDDEHFLHFVIAGTSIFWTLFSDNLYDCFAEDYKDADELLEKVLFSMVQLVEGLEESHEEK